MIYLLKSFSLSLIANKDHEKKDSHHPSVTKSSDLIVTQIKESTDSNTSLHITDDTDQLPDKKSTFKKMVDKFKHPTRSRASSVNHDSVKPPTLSHSYSSTTHKLSDMVAEGGKHERADSMIGKTFKMKGHLNKDTSFTRAALIQDLTSEYDLNSNHSPSSLPTSRSFASFHGSQNMHEDLPPSTAWILKFSHDGNYLAVGRQDGLVIVWSVITEYPDSEPRNGSPASSAPSFSNKQHTNEPISNEFKPDTIHHTTENPSVPVRIPPTRRRSQSEIGALYGRQTGIRKKSNFQANQSDIGESPQKSPSSISSFVYTKQFNDQNDGPQMSPKPESVLSNMAPSIEERCESKQVFNKTPVRIFKHHTLPITNLCWSKGDFLISSSLEPNVCLWHISQPECLSVFKHKDVVTAVKFHPIDCTLFASGSLDGRIRVWSLMTKKLLYWNEIPKDPITAIGFTQDGSTVVAGTLSGICVFYDFIGLKYSTQVHLTAGKGLRSKEAKITGIETMPQTTEDEEKLLVTSADSHIRLINVRDKSLFKTYKGFDLKSFGSFASFSPFGDYIITTSEDKHIYIWDTLPNNNSVQYSGVFSSVVHRNVDTAKQIGQVKFSLSNNHLCNAIFTPWTVQDIANQAIGSPVPYRNSTNTGIAIVVADDHGHIYVMETRD
ncbi:WD repeat-containing protein 44 [Globomyces sp. JEL0801]|nr:WD repeat-containing protein 44 [Globomyces sp. JEL0801]